MATTIHGWEQVETDRVLVKRFLVGLVGGDREVLGDAATPDCVVHRVAREQDAVGPEAIAAVVEGETLDDVTVEFVETVAADERMAVYATVSGRTVGPTRDGTADVAPTGWRKELSLFGIYRLEDDRVAEAWLLSEPVEAVRSDGEEPGTRGSLVGRLVTWLRGA